MSIDRDVLSQDDGKGVIEMRLRDFLGFIWMFVSTVSYVKTKCCQGSDSFSALMKTSICFCCAPEDSTPQHTDR